MANGVKRRYVSTKRAEQARQTRESVLDAAQTLFLAQGYAATSMQSIADQADVAVQTVYAVFRNKRRLIDELIERAIGGADASGESTSKIATEPDPARRARLDARLARQISERIAPIVRVAEEAAASDPKLAADLALMKARRREEMTAMARILAGPGGKKPLPNAAATLYVLYSPDVARMLMGDYGWSADRYEKWLADMLLRTVIERDA